MSDQVADVSAKYLSDVDTNGVPVGYKQTEVGVIPEDWVVATIAEKHTLATGSTPPTSNLKNYGETYLFVSPADLSDKKYILKTEKKLSEQGFKISRKYPAGSTLFTCIGSTIGKTGLAPVELTSNQQINAIFPNEDGDAEFTYYAVTYIAPKVKALAGQQAVPLVNKTEFGETLFCFPRTKQEQTAIANALSDVDALISELEKLIAKKQAIKTATMQQLLTGRTRLPQFALREDGTPKGTKPSELGEIPEDWEVYRFDQNFTIYAGGDVPKDSFSKIKTDTYPYPIFANAIQGRGLYGYTSHSRSKPNSVTITARGYLGHAEYRNEPFFPIVRLLVMEPVGSVDSRFATYAINELVEFPTESTGVPQLTAPQVGKFSISAPVDVNEQTDIATILSDMDEEIQALEQHLGKTRQIKQGMMQELLTGKTRLVQPINKESQHG